MIYPLINLKQLEFIDAYENNISDISLFERANFDELKQITLYGNLINDYYSYKNLFMSKRIKMYY